eukprot:COSAG01_NODE_3846_length_5644_cov_48.943192_2_plen_36_part_00
MRCGGEMQRTWQRLARLVSAVRDCMTEAGRWDDHV